MPDLPYFPFYPQDFLGDGKVRLMSPTEVGVYFLLLCHEWLEGPLPNEPDRLARIAGASEEEMEEAWDQVRPCFEETDDGRLVQPRLEEERAKALDKREKARKAARARWGEPDDDASADADAMHPQSERNADARSVADANHNQNQKNNNTQGASGRNADADASASDEPSPAVRKVWRHYVERYADRYSEKRADRLKLTAAGRDGKIRGRLREDYSPEELCRAIDGCFEDPWHRDRDKHDLEYILRNQPKVEDFLNRAERNGGRPDERPDGREELAAIAQGAADE